MTEYNTRDNETNLGNIQITPQALEIISGIAISQVKGVHGMSRDAKTLLKNNYYRKGVNVHAGEQGELALDIHLSLEYGVNVPQVVREIQTEVKQQVLEMTDIYLEEVNIHITRIEVQEKDNGFDYKSYVGAK